MRKWIVLLLSLFVVGCTGAGAAPEPTAVSAPTPIPLPATTEAIWLDEVPLRRMGRAEGFGKLAAVLVSDVASYVTGAAVLVDGGKARAY